MVVVTCSEALVHVMSLFLRNTHSGVTVWCACYGGFVNGEAADCNGDDITSLRGCFSVTVEESPSSHYLRVWCLMDDDDDAALCL